MILHMANLPAEKSVLLEISILGWAAILDQTRLQHSDELVMAERRGVVANRTRSSWCNQPGDAHSI